MPSFSADGKRLYYLISQAHHAAVTADGIFWTANLETGQRERLLPDFRMSQYQVSSDGHQVVFVRANPSGHSTVWLAPLDGSSPPRRLSPMDSENAFFGASGEIFFAGGDGPEKFLYRINEDGSGLRQVTPDPVTILYDVSPDGNWVAAWARRGVVLIPAGGGPSTVVCPACANRAPPDQPPLVSWSRDGKFLYLHDTGIRQTFAIPLGRGQVLPLLPAGGIRSPGLDALTLPGARPIPQPRAFPGPAPSTYAYARVSAHRNIFRVPVP